MIALGLGLEIPRYSCGRVLRLIAATASTVGCRPPLVIRALIIPVIPFLQDSYDKVLASGARDRRISESEWV